MTSTNIERNLELNFPLDKVKQDIDRVIKQGVYTLHSKNDILNTYRIGKITGLESVNMNITLKSIDGNKTNIHIVVSERIRNSGHQSIVDKMIDAFLERLSKALTGATDEDLKSVSKGNKGCVVTLLVMISIALSIVLFSSCKKSSSSNNTNNTNTQNYFKVGANEYTIANAYYQVDSANNFSVLYFTTPNLIWNPSVRDLQTSGNLVEFDLSDISNTLQVGNFVNPAQIGWAGCVLNYVYPVGGIDYGIDDTFPGNINIARTNSNYEIHFQFKLTTSQIVEGSYIGSVQRIY